MKSNYPGTNGFPGNSFLNTRKKAFLVALAVFCLAMIASWMAAEPYQACVLEKQRGKLENELFQYGNSLTIILNRRFFSLEGLRSFVLVSIKTTGEIDPDEFEIFASGLQSGMVDIRTITIAPGGVQAFVYPYEGNEVVLGHDLINDERANVRADVQRAIETRRLALSEPYILRQGGLGQVAREAIFVEDEFWGLLSIVLDVPILVDDVGLFSDSSQWLTAIRDSSGHVFYGEQAVFERDPVVARVNLPEGYWELGSIPRSGWKAAVKTQTMFFLADRGVHCRTIFWYSLPPGCQA